MMALEQNKKPPRAEARRRKPGLGGACAFVTALASGLNGTGTVALLNKTKSRDAVKRGDCRGACLSDLLGGFCVQRHTAIDFR
jgi:hypothetical protein